MATNRITKHGVKVDPKRAKETREFFHEMRQLGITACFGNNMTVAEMTSFLKTLSPSEL